MSDPADKIQARNFLKLHGTNLIEQGYAVVPIQQGKKAPGFDGWQKVKSTKNQINEWLDEGFKNAGVGIVTKFVFAVDIDCLDEKAAVHFEQWCKDKFGPSPVRIGKPPKRLLMYRTITPFRKRRSNEYRDEWGDKQQIEILGDGQQFVAFHIHPDTNKPYVWIDDQSPLNINATTLTEVTESQVTDLIEAFEEYAQAQEWEIHKTRRVGGVSGDVGVDDPFAEDTQPIDLTTEELRSRLMLIKVPEGDAQDYDEWREVGMALYHQFEGDQIGLDMWIEWCETADNFDKDSCERHWETFDISGKKRAPLTARYILRLAKEAVEKTALELGVKLRDLFVKAKNLAEWHEAKNAAQEAEIDALNRSTLATVAKESHDRITGTRAPLIEIKKAIAFKPKKGDHLPTWCEGWCYDVEEDKFFNLDRKLSASKQGFDAMYDRQALTKTDILNGKSNPTLAASELALNVYKVPTVEGKRYMPGRDQLFQENGATFANSYPEHEIPALPESSIPRDKRNVEFVKKHIAHLLEDPREQRHFLNGLAFIVQNPGRHLNFGIFLQGTEGDGKSFWGECMRCVMGTTNVSVVNGDTIITSNFSDWSYGSCLCCVEEIKIASSRGLDKWQAINKVKDKITNNIIEVNRKGKPSFNVVNTQNYLLFSNYKDALPLDENSRRFMVFFSRWQKKEDLIAFLADNPNYYKRLYEAIAVSPGAIREWLLNHQIDDDFEPYGLAPVTKALKTMIKKSRPEFIHILSELINDDTHVECSADLVDITALADVYVALGLDWPASKSVAAMLEREGYESLGKVRLPDEGLHSFYSRSPELFTSHLTTGEEVTEPAMVRAYLKARRAKLADDF